MIVFEDFVYISRKNFNLYVFLLRYSLVTPASAASKKSLKFRNYFTDNVVIKSYDKKVISQYQIDSIITWAQNRLFRAWE